MFEGMTNTDSTNDWSSNQPKPFDSKLVEDPHKNDFQMKSL